MTHPVLTTERLVMRPLTSEHLELEALLDLDADVMGHVGGPAGSRADVERSHARRMELASRGDGLGFWMTFTRTDPTSPTALDPTRSSG
jgi:hypothetical protein